MTVIPLAAPTLLAGATDSDGDRYGYARLPAGAYDRQPGRVGRIPYGRFRNVYLYITERCQIPLNRTNGRHAV